jgi:murein DD-endopeptidase MepM/ murein hydrolase activator NlpD
MPAAYHRPASLFAALAMLASCATAPEPRRGNGPFSLNELSLCGGVSVSNAPAADGYRRIISYTPYLSLRGVALARAPVNGCVSSGFGPRRGGAGAVHEGLDLFTGSPRPVYAGGGGRVVAAGDQRGYGLTIEIDHGAGVATRYAHLSAIAPGMRPGARLYAGDEIGRTGKSGNATAVHLHYEILVDGEPLDPLRVTAQS